MNLNPAPSRDDFLVQRFQQVALTYTQPWFFRGLAFSILALAASIHWTPSTADLLGTMWMLIAFHLLCCLVIVATMCVTIHLRMQLDDWRSRLTPRFHIPHLTVAAFVMAAIIVVPALLARGPMAPSISGAIAALVVLCTYIAWLVGAPHLGLLYGCAVTFIIARFHLAVAIPDLLQGRFPTVAWSIIFMGITGFMLLGAYLSRLNGQAGMAIARSAAIDGHYRARMTRNPLSRDMGPVAIFFDAVFGRIFALIAVTPPTTITPLRSAWARIRQRRLTTLSGASPSYIGGGCLLAILVIMVTANLLITAIYGPHDDDSTTAFLGIYALTIPLSVACFAWPSRWPNLSTESLLPTSRRQFTSELFIAFAIDLAALWFSGVLVSLIGDFLWQPTEFRAAAPNIAAAIPLSAAGMVYTYGLVLWLMRLRHILATMTAFVLAITGAFIPTAQLTANYPRLNLHQISEWIIFLTAIGAILTLDAYRRWRRTELD